MNAWLLLTVPISVLLAVAAGGGVFIESLYRDNPYFAAQGVAQDFISLVVVLPVLIVSAILARRGSARAWLVWLGVMIYLVYSYVIAAFVVEFNLLFLVYVALLGCSLYGLVGGLATLDKVGIGARFTTKTPTRVISIFLIVLGVLFYFLWLSEIIPALITGEIPASVLDNDKPTNAVHVLDMAWILPAFGITAISLWRKQALGYTLAGALLSYIVFLVLAVLSMVVVMSQRGQPVVFAQALVFGGVLAISLGLLVWYLKSVALR